MLRRGIGQERMFEEAARRSSLDDIANLIDWVPVACRLCTRSCQSHQANGSPL